MCLEPRPLRQIGSAFWLRIPVGKLHNDRYIPLQPQLKELLDDWVANHRPAGVRSDRLLIDRNRPATGYRVSQILHDQAVDAGIGHVTAHQLLHTLATQARAAGVPLEVIQRRLGHASIRGVKQLGCAPSQRQCGDDAGGDAH